MKSCKNIFSKMLLKYFSISLIVFSIISCGGKDTIKPATLSVSNPGMSTGDNKTIKQASLIVRKKGSMQVVSNHEMSTEEVIADKNKSKHESANVNIFKAPSKGANNNTSLSDPSFEPVVFESDYHLGPGDVIEIEVYQVDELNRETRISSNGFIKLPLTGKIKVSGLTATELETEISKRLERYLQEPSVSVYIKEYRSQTVTILGAVRKPQVYVVTRQNYLLDIISISGGLTQDAGDICYIQRGNKTIIVNIKDLLIGGKINLNIPVYSKDIINVPAGGVVFVSGSVKAPGSFNMKGTLTLTQVIGMANGLTFEAIRNPIKVYRDSGEGAREMINVDYNAILANKAKDIVLQNKDVVIVEKSGLKGFIKSVSGILSFGGLSVRGGI